MNRSLALNYSRSYHEMAACEDRKCMMLKLPHSKLLYYYNMGPRHQLWIVVKYPYKSRATSLVKPAYKLNFKRPFIEGLYDYPIYNW